MKLKNSYILLIVMAIFLLVSIGSVCASEDITTDVNLANDESDVVLADDTNAGTTADITQKIDTSIESSDVKINEKEDKIINLTVNDNESKPINDINKGNLTVSENNKTIGFSYNNSQITITDKLNVGNHSLIINYLGNNIYKNSTTKIILSIFGDNTLEVPSTASSNGNTVEIPIKLTNGVDDNTNLLNSSNTKIEISYKNGNATLNVEEILSKNKLTIDVAGKVPATLIVNYTENNKTISKKVSIKYLSQINAIESSDINEKDNLTFKVTVLDNENNPIANITKSNLTIDGVKDFKYNSTTNEVLITGLTKGVHNLLITYKGNELFNASSKSTVVNVRGSVDINVNETSINVNSTKKGEITIINITNGIDTFPVIKDNMTISVSSKNGNNTTTINVKSFEIKNGKLLFELENGDFTTATLTINYNNGESLKNITLNRIFNAKIEALNTVNEYQHGNFTFKLTDVDTNTPLSKKELSLYTVGNIKAGFSANTNENGIATFITSHLYEFDNANSSFTMRQLDVGNHEVELSTKDAIKSTALKVNLTIKKANINIKIDKFKEEYGTNKNVTITVTNANDGQPVPSIILHLNMPQTSGKDYYFQTDANGQSKISVTQLVGGTYNITVSNNDTKNINKQTEEDSITIVPKPAKLAITSSLTIYYNSGNTVTIKLTDAKTGKALSGIYIKIQFDNAESYLLGQTDKKGQITLQVSLDMGKHKIVVDTADNRYSASQLTKFISVKKASGTFTAPKVTAYYKQGKYFTITLKNSKTKKPIYDAKVNIRIYISSSQYYNYNGNTGYNGQLKLLIDLKPGTYKVEIRGADSKDYTAKMLTSKIVVKKAPTKLIPTKLTAKKGVKKFFKVTVKNTKTKKVIPTIKIKIKVYTGKKSKTYTVKTNKKGIAYFNVKSLKVGTHKVVVTSANKYCVAKAAKSTIKITKK